MKKRLVRHRSNATVNNFSNFKTTNLRPYALGHTLGMMSMIVLVFYGLFVWFSNYESAFIVAKYPISFSFYDWTMLFGLVQSYVMFYILGWVFAKMYNSS